MHSQKNKIKPIFLKEAIAKYLVSIPT